MKTIRHVVVVPADLFKATETHSLAIIIAKYVVVCSFVDIGRTVLVVHIVFSIYLIALISIKRY